MNERVYSFVLVWVWKLLVMTPLDLKAERRSRGWTWLDQRVEVRRDQLPRDIDKQHHPGDHDQETALSYVKGGSKAANDTVYEYEYEY